MALTELVQHFNRLNGVESEDCFVQAKGRVLAHFGGCVLGSLFQPVVAPASGRVIGHEAHLQVLGGEVAGLPPPAVFLAARDEVELLRFDRLARTLHVLNFLRDSPGEEGFLSLNLHPEVLRSGAGDAQMFEAILMRCGLAPGRIVLEVADDAYEALPRLARSIDGFRAQGYRVALDNFGRHTASLERLEVLRPDIVKFDRSLIGHAGHLSLAQRVMSGLAVEIRQLGMAVACQCIENPLQLQVARDAGVDWLQGYLLGCPAATCRPVEPPCCPRVAA